MGREGESRMREEREGWREQNERREGEIEEEGESE